jgi:two-component system sensor histidine kinase KdpD
VAAVASFLAWNYFFLRPYHTFIVHDPQDWLALLVFLIVGVVMGLQTARMREREADARAREQETALLNRMSASLVSIPATRAMADVLLREVLAITGATTAVLFVIDAGDLTPFCLEPAGAPPGEQRRRAQWVARTGTAIGVPARPGIPGWPVSVVPHTVPPGRASADLYLPAQSASLLEAVLYVGERAESEAYSLHDARLLVSIANLTAGFLERQRLESAAAKAEALRESDRLKSTLISSVSHELKTPLAAVTATITSLLEGDVAWEADTVRPELQAVRDDLARLNDSIGALLDLSRLKADAWTPQPDWYEFGEIVGGVLAKLPEAARRRIIFDIPDALPSIRVDFQQWLQALLHLVENALAYAPTETSITVGAAATADAVRMWVEDRGPGIAAAERKHIFEQFFRGRAATGTPTGTGLGLAITAEIVRYHGGHIQVEDVEPHGARFVIVLPREGSHTGGTA